MLHIHIYVVHNVFVQVCNEAQVTEIKPNHDISVINKRDAADISEQDTTTPGPCDLPEHKDEFPNIIFTYKVGADLDAIKETVEKYTENSAEVQSAIVLDFLDMIIFKMNRAAYLQVMKLLSKYCLITKAVIKLDKLIIHISCYSTGLH